MANITITNIDTGSVMLGGEEWEDAVFPAAAAGIVPAGTVFEKSGTDYVFAAAAPTAGAALAVLPYDLDVAGAGDVAVRLLIAGRVDRTRLKLNGSALPVPQTVVDALRDFSIIAVPVEQCGAYDNPQP